MFPVNPVVSVGEDLASTPHRPSHSNVSPTIFDYYSYIFLINLCTFIGVSLCLIFLLFCKICISVIDSRLPGIVPSWELIARVAGWM